MYKYKKPTDTTININNSYIAESLEHKIKRMMNNGEKIGIKDASPLIYTERKDGVHPAMNIRTDRFEIALEGMEKVDKSWKAKRAEKQKSVGEQAKEGMEKEKNTNSGAESTPGTTPEGGPK